MSEKILKALLQLFAIIARVEGTSAAGITGRSIVERFLRQQFSPEVAAGHLARFDAYLQAYRTSGGESRNGRKRTSLNSVKVLKICAQVNEELERRQKIVVLVHLLEFIHAGGEVGEQEQEFVSTVADAFTIEQEEYKRCKAFVDGLEQGREDAQHLLYIDSALENTLAQAHHLHAHALEGELRVLHLPSVGLYLMRYLGNDRVLLNGQPMSKEHHYVLSNGSSVRPQHGRPIYYSDILGSFMAGAGKPGIVFKAEKISYTFSNGRKGLHDLQLAETSGKLIGIMGGSGSGKSTLLSVLNGSLKPTTGKVTINGIDVHGERDRIRGVIGHVSQDDLLIEELSVFQNLYYNAKLCFGDQSDEKITERVDRLLQTLGLYESKDLKVGNPLEKMISGGQRKRLNIALELIREPSVLFVDEPTSGLSSRDSENIMDLLKELALKGRLVFVVIHQPSSDIYKLFDRLLMVDQEGYPVYYGDPVDAVVYFKRVTGQVNSDEGQCAACGNVNPEQIFDILEARMVDEYGNEIDQRRIGPEAWNEVFRAQMDIRTKVLPSSDEVPKSTFVPPGVIKQFSVFWTRDVLSKLANRQYVLINLLEAPALAFIMTFFLRYYRTGHGTTGEYVFRHNDNLPQFLFISVIVALFLGLTVSAEEIIRDRRILQRERFLSLSRYSYILSKVAIMFLISAAQTLLFTLVGTLMLGIEGMTLAHWATLFSASCFANMLGLNVSASFNSAKVIYIIIPVLIIPQLLFSGIIVKFDKLHPWFANERSVPWIGNIMASRWAYEAMAVTQFTDNAYEKNFYAFDQRMKTANWKKDLWVRELKNHAQEVRRRINGEGVAKDMAYSLALIQRELSQEQEVLQGFTFASLQKLTPGAVNNAVLDELDEALQTLTLHYRSTYQNAEHLKEDRIAQLTATPADRAAYFALIDGHRNENLADVLTNKNDVNVIVEYDGSLVQKSDPVYLDPARGGLFDAHFYAPTKLLFGARIDTLWANILVLWGMTVFFFAALQFDLFPRLLKRFSGEPRAAK
ncbi:MAG: ATP-binding cassette domain-containing protein [Flavobacteriales bacterium]